MSDRFIKTSSGRYINLDEIQQAVPVYENDLTIIFKDGRTLEMNELDSKDDIDLMKKHLDARVIPGR